MEPLFTFTGSSWAAADGADFPTQGEVFWPRPYEVSRGSAVLFSVDENVPGKDSVYVVDHPEPLYPVLDFYNLEYTEGVERLLTARFPVDAEIRAKGKVFAWCKDDLLLGPFDAHIDGDSFGVAAGSFRLDRVPFREGEDAIFQFPTERIYCAPTSPFTGHLDCRPDAEILKTALGHAVDIARTRSEEVPKFLATKALLRSAAEELRERDSLDERQIDIDRIERALRICTNSNEVQTRAGELAKTVLGHPAITSEIEHLRARALEEARATARETLRSELHAERAELDSVRAELVALAAERSNLASEAARVERELATLSSDVDRQLTSLETSVTERVATLVDDATELLADSVLLRAVGIGAQVRRDAVSSRVGRPFPSVPEQTPRVDNARIINELWAARAVSEPDAVVLRRIYAAFQAALLPVMIGNGGRAALAAYAGIACAGRTASLPVTHDFLHPVDLLGVRASNPDTGRLHADLLCAVDESVRSEGPGLVILEAFNHAPTESYLVPWLQTDDRGIAVPAAAQAVIGRERFCAHEDLLVAATSVSGTTTAPLSPDLWSFCVAIDAPARPGSPRSISRAAAPDFRASTASNADTAAIDRVVVEVGTALDDLWPIDDGILDAARRFGTALAAVGSSEHVAEDILECLFLPALATSLSGSELVAAIDTLADCGRVRDPSRRKRLHRLAQRFRHRFA